MNVLEWLCSKLCFQNRRCLDLNVLPPLSKTHMLILKFICSWYLRGEVFGKKLGLDEATGWGPEMVLVEEETRGKGEGRRGGGRGREREEGEGSQEGSLAQSHHVIPSLDAALSSWTPPLPELGERNLCSL